MRARGALFTRLATFGGVPTIADDAQQAALDARATRDMARALRHVLVDAFTHSTLARSHREHWTTRAPAMLCFGARLHAELARLTRQPGNDPRPVRSVALFQLAASLLDWIGDEQDGAAEVVRLLPAGQLPPLVVDAAARGDVMRRARYAGGTALAFATVLVALLDRVAQLPADAVSRAGFAHLLGAAYDAELASFAVTSREERAMLARRKSELPTLVCGSLAGMTLGPADRALVERAAAAIAPILCTIDDMADLGDDLRRGQLNTLAPACDDGDVARAMREVLADDTVERHAADAAACFHRVHAVAIDAGVSVMHREALMQWLRTRAWRWLS